MFAHGVTLGGGMYILVQAHIQPAQVLRWQQGGSRSHPVEGGIFLKT